MIEGLVERCEAPDSELQPHVYAAAIRWCGEKDRETFPGDIEYFKHNWRALPGLRKFVADEALRARTPALKGE